MATNTTKNTTQSKTSAKEKEVKVEKMQSKEVDATWVETDNLKKENETLKAQMEQMMAMLNEIKVEKDKINESVKVNPTTESNEDEFNYVEISPHKPIAVVSLSDGGVNLRTSKDSSGKTFRFDKFGHKVSITHADLSDVLSTNRSFIEDGTVYICDKQFVNNNYLEEKYRTFLTVDTINNILNFSIEDIKEMVANTTSAIQDTIVSLLVKKINNNESVDFNKIEAIGQECVNPCNIRDLAYKLSNQDTESE
jgi:hypothetical protein